MAEQDMKGVRALVTGGSGGIGFSIARGLARRGAVVVVTGRNSERGEAAAKELAQIVPECAFMQGDAGDPASIADVCERAAKHMGGIDTLVSAGAEGKVGPTPFADMTAQQITENFDARFRARIFPLHAAIPYLRKSDRANAVLITTDAARHPTPGESIIGAAGAAVLLLVKALARELSRDRIRVNGVALTLTSDTPSWDRIFAKASFENKLFSKALDRFPSGRAPTADEVAEAALFLCSSGASQITGQTVSVNGGLSFGGW
jgi:2-hydroxycyclohexanecarboxyl-CoA dehydrogenase